MRSQQIKISVKAVERDLKRRSLSTERDVIRRFRTPLGKCHTATQNIGMSFYHSIKGGRKVNWKVNGNYNYFYISLLLRCQRNALQKVPFPMNCLCAFAPKKSRAFRSHFEMGTGRFKRAAAAASLNNVGARR